MKKYTVVVIRPGYVAEHTCPGCVMDGYLALVKTATPREAMDEGRQEAFDADARAGYLPESVEHYEAVMVFDGHIKPVFWNWQR